MGFFDSEMERSFLKTAKKKGWVKDESIVKEASTTKIAATGNVDVDICVLIDGLRAKGHEKQAEALEESYLEYKKAASELYDIDTDEGIEFLEMAHPDGDQKIGDSSKGYGDVETLLSAHKKIRDIATKDPSKKKSIAEAATKITKESAEDYGALNVSGLISNLNYKITMPMVIQAFQKNSGPMYNFLNVYYHDFFKGMYSYYTDIHKIFGEPRVNRSAVIQRLNSNPEIYLNNISSSISTGDLLAQARTQDAVDYIKWFFVNRDSIADTIMERFNAKYPGLDKSFNYVSSDVTANMRAVADAYKSRANDPMGLFKLISEHKKNGMDKYVSTALDAFHGTQYALSYAQSVNAVLEKIRPIIEQEAVRRQEQTGVGRERALSTPLENFREASRILAFLESETASQNSGIINQVAAIVSSGRPFEDVKRALSRMNINVNSPQDLVNLSKEYLKYAKEKAQE